MGEYMEERMQEQIEGGMHEMESLQSEIQHLRKCIEFLRKTHKPKFKHFCLDWDGLEIDEFSPEFNSCTCAFPDSINDGCNHPPRI